MIPKPYFLLIFLIHFRQTLSQTLFLTPPYFDLADGKNITASSTCGEDDFGRPINETFCKTIGANPGSDIEGPQYWQMWDPSAFITGGQLCDFCNSANSEKAHPVQYATLHTDRWYQSPPLSRGVKYRNVTITIDLQQEFHVAYIYIRMANSPRPAMWKLEKSLDGGKTWTPWQYFAESNEDCLKNFGVKANAALDTDDQVICETAFSSLVPLEEGEIVVSLVNDRPSSRSSQLSSMLQEFTKASMVRLNLMRTKTLFGQLMSPGEDPTIFRRYYYSIKDINIGGRCVCNGHARQCQRRSFDTTPQAGLTTQNFDQSLYYCACIHNTCGPQCDRCCPGYQNQKWAPATYDNENACQACQCNGHSDSCEFDEERRHAVCFDCRDNTQGERCDRCVDGWYLPSGRPINESRNACERCSQCPRYEGATQLTSKACHDGDAVCKCLPQFTNEDCSACARGYTGHWPLCLPCRCYINGSLDDVCDSTSGSGVCACKPKYAGEKCEQCADGYFNSSSLLRPTPTSPSPTPVEECISCECDTSGSIDVSQCDPATGQCICKEGFAGPLCQTCAPGFHSYPECIKCDCALTGVDPERICDADNGGSCLCLDNFQGAACDECKPGHYKQGICQSCNCTGAGVQPGDIQCVEDGQCTCRQGFTGLQCRRCAIGYYGYPDCKACSCADLGTVDGMDGTTLGSCDEYGTCTCKDGTTGPKCSACRPNLYLWPDCVPCNCDPYGSIDSRCTNSEARQILCECKRNVQGRICSHCRPGFWNLAGSNPDGCLACQCETAGTLGSMDVCDQRTGQCVCKRDVVARQCDTCRDGFYGLSENLATGCKSCQCDVGGAVSDRSCDKSTGACFCKSGIEGMKCDRPKSSHYIPALFQLRFELEDGYQSESGVRSPARYDYNTSLMSTFTWRGFAVMSSGQPMVKLDFESARFPRKFRHFFVRFSYVNPSEEAVEGAISLATAGDDRDQSIDRIVFPSTGSSLSPQMTRLFGPLEKDPATQTFTVNLQNAFASQPNEQTETGQPPLKLLFIDNVQLVPLEFKESTISRLLEESCSFENFGSRTGEFCVLSTFSNEFPSNRLIPTSPTCNSKANAFSVVDTDKDKLLETLSKSPAPSSTDPTFFSVSPLRRDVQFWLVARYRSIASSTRRVDVKVESMSNVGQEILVTFLGNLVLPRCDGICRQVVTSQNGDSSSPLSIDLSRHPGATCLKVTFSNDDNEVTVWADESFLVETSKGGQDSGNLLNRLLIPRPRCIVANGQDPKCISSLDNLDTDSPSARDVRLNLAKMFVQSKCFDDEARSDDKQAIDGFCDRSIFSMVTTLYDGASSCDCNPQGVIDSASPRQCSLFGGQCPCKRHVIGRDCSECQSGYFNFPSCTKCTCTAGICDSSGNCICPRNVVGKQCDTCRPGTFGYHRILGCSNCACHRQGTKPGRTDQCNPITGQCECAVNVAGRKCDACVVGNYLFPRCEKCDCDIAGVLPAICDQTNGRCLCKSNVLSLSSPRCNLCQMGHFNLASDNPSGCTKCFCSGVSKTCSSAGNLFWKSLSVPSTNTQEWTLSHPKCFSVRETSASLVSVVASSSSSLGCQAGFVFVPQGDFLMGSKVLSYSGRVNFTLKCESCDAIDGENAFTSSTQPLLILQNKKRYGPTSNILGLFSSGTGKPSNSDVTYDKSTQKLSVSIPLIEESFRLLSNGLGAAASPSFGLVPRNVFMSILANLDTVGLRIPGGLDSSSDRDAVFEVIDFSLQIATDRSDGRNGGGSDAKRISAIEQCSCPQGYSGYSCEQCSNGYFQETYDESSFVCSPCRCGGKSDTCDKVSGVCYECQSGFEGDHCERCKPGHYYDATYDVCRLCSCPGNHPTSNFAQNCTANSNGLMIACQCKPGYMGRTCGECAANHYGTPLDRISCQRCSCHGNTLLGDLEACDRVTGQCINCLNNTAGPDCGRCKPWHFGDAKGRHACEACSCDTCGAQVCNPKTGACVCKTNVTGLSCDKCLPNHYGFHACDGCRPCDCGLASVSKACDSNFGKCSCVDASVTGQRCDVCAEGFWAYSQAGCRKCDCGGGSFSCDPANGVCKCKRGYTGSKCDRCKLGWLDIKGVGCRQCDDCVVRLVNDTSPTTALLATNFDQLKNLSASIEAHGRLQKIDQGLKEIEEGLTDYPDTLKDVRDKTAATKDSVNAFKEGLSSGDGDVFKMVDQLKTIMTTRLLNDSADFNAVCLANYEAALNHASDVEKQAMDALNKLQTFINNINNPSQLDVTSLLDEAKAALAQIEGVEIAHHVTDTQALRDQARELVDSLQKWNATYHPFYEDLRGKLKINEELGESVEIAEQHYSQTLADTQQLAMLTASADSRSSNQLVEIRKETNFLKTGVDQGRDHVQAGLQQILMTFGPSVEDNLRLLAANISTCQDVKAKLEKSTEQRSDTSEIRAKIERVENHVDDLHTVNKKIEKALEGDANSHRDAKEAATRYSEISEKLRTAYDRIDEQAKQTSQITSSLDALKVPSSDDIPSLSPVTSSVATASQTLKETLNQRSEINHNLASSADSVTAASRTLESLPKTAAIDSKIEAQKPIISNSANKIDESLGRSATLLERATALKRRMLSLAAPDPATANTVGKAVTDVDATSRLLDAIKADAAESRQMMTSVMKRSAKISMSIEKLKSMLKKSRYLTSSMYDIKPALKLADTKCWASVDMYKPSLLDTMALSFKVVLDHLPCPNERSLPQSSVVLYIGPSFDAKDPTQIPDHLKVDLTVREKSYNYTTTLTLYEGRYQRQVSKSFERRSTENPDCSFTARPPHTLTISRNQAGVLSMSIDFSLGSVTEESSRDATLDLRKYTLNIGSLFPPRPTHVLIGRPPADFALRNEGVPYLPDGLFEVDSAPGLYQTLSINGESMALFNLRKSDCAIASPGKEKTSETEAAKFLQFDGDVSFLSVPTENTGVHRAGNASQFDTLYVEFSFVSSSFGSFPIFLSSRDDSSSSNGDSSVFASRGGPPTSLPLVYLCSNGSTESDDFIAIDIIDGGHVRLRHRMWHDVVVVTVDQVTLTPNTPYTVSAFVSGTKTTLSVTVDSFETFSAETSTPPSSHQFNVNTVYFGGLDELVPSSLINVHQEDVGRFTGCLWGVRMAQRSRGSIIKFKPFHVKSHGVRFAPRSCPADKSSSKMISFLPKSSERVPSRYVLDVETDTVSSIALLVKTTNPGLIFFARDNLGRSQNDAIGAKETKYLELYIDANQTLHLVYQPSRNHPVISANYGQLWNRGKWLPIIMGVQSTGDSQYSIFLNLADSKIITHPWPFYAPMNPKPHLLEGPRIRFFFGSLPKSLSKLATSSVSFQGCLHSVFINDQLQAFSKPDPFGGVFGGNSSPSNGDDLDENESAESQNRAADFALGSCHVADDSSLGESSACRVLDPITEVPPLTDDRKIRYCARFDESSTSFATFKVASNMLVDRSSFTFRFRTLYRYGLFLYLSAETAGADFLIVFLADGQVVFQYDTGDGALTLSTCPRANQHACRYNFADGQMHKVTVFRDAKQYFLEIDSLSFKENIKKPELVQLGSLEKPFYFGGLDPMFVENQAGTLLDDRNQGFIQLCKSFSLEDGTSCGRADYGFVGKLWDLTASRNLIEIENSMKPCYAGTEDGLYFSAGKLSNAGSTDTYAAVVRPKKPLTTHELMRIVIKPRSSHGIVTFVHNELNPVDNFFTVFMRAGRLYVLASPKLERVSQTDVIPTDQLDDGVLVHNDTVCDGIWHSINIWFESNGYVHVGVDFQESVVFASSDNRRGVGNANPKLLDSTVYLGGLPNSVKVKYQDSGNRALVKLFSTVTQSIDIGDVTSDDSSLSTPASSYRGCLGGVEFSTLVKSVPTKVRLNELEIRGNIHQSRLCPTN